jgi:hypothetical protein
LLALSILKDGSEYGVVAAGFVESAIDFEQG